MKQINENYTHPQNKNNSRSLTGLNSFCYLNPAFAKSEAEPGNSNDLQLANNNTPPACFLVCCTRTPKENALSVLLSMVACNGKGFALCCVPIVAVFQPVTRYRPQAWKLQAVTSQYSQLEQITMLFKFLLLGETRLTISIRANSEQEARQRFKHSSPMIFIARINQGGVYA